MKLLIIFLACFLLLPLTQAKASDERLELIANNIYADLKNEKYKGVEEALQKHADEQTKTRHGTDTIFAIFDHILHKIDNEADFKPWLAKTNTWQSQYPNSFLSAFFLHRLEHQEAWHYKHSDEWDKLLQSIRRSHKKTLDNGYNNALKIIDKHPDKWRIHAHLAANHERYKLTLKEIKEHLYTTQKLNKGEVSSMSGFVSALSPYTLGRTDEMIAAGIQSVLKKYPERNLSKPEYIDAATKQEIEDEIFELTIGQMLLTARKYINEASNEGSTNILIPVAYKAIYKDLEMHYKDRPEKLKRHPLSYKRKAVWNEITQSYKTLFKNFPKSGQHLTSYLELAINLERTETIGKTISQIEENDPNYNPEHLAPIQCRYYSSLRGDQRLPNTDEKMYTSCKKASKYMDEEIYYYRAGWAARKIGNFEESNQLIEKALKFTPKNHIYLTDICWNHKDLKRFDKALDYCDRAITINRKHARAWLGRSHIYYHGFKNTAQAQKDAAMYEQLTKGQ